MTFFSDNQLIKQIHDEPDLRNVWNGLTDEAKRQVLKEADGDNWHLDRIVYDVAEQSLEAAKTLGVEATAQAIAHEVYSRKTRREG